MELILPLTETSLFENGLYISLRIFLLLTAILSINQSGAIGFFTKPTSIRNLLAEIDRIQQLQTEKLKAVTREERAIEN